MKLANGWRLLLVAGAVVCLADLALAQPGGGRGGRGRGMMGGGMGDPIQLLENDQIKDYLKITDDEKAYLKLMADTQRDEDQKFRDSMRDTPQEERMAKWMEHQTARNASLEKQLTEILGTDRVKRIKQIQLQAEGPRALMREDVQKELNITAEQKTKMEEMRQSSMQEMRGIMQSAGGDREKMREAFEEFRVKMETKAMEILTDAQKTKLKEMQGEKLPFELPRPTPGGRGERGNNNAPAEKKAE